MRYKVHVLKEGWYEIEAPDETIALDRAEVLLNEAEMDVLELDEISD